MAQAEAMGLLKMDFLGLDNLKTITNILQYPIEKTLDWTLVVPEEREKMLAVSSSHESILYCHTSWSCRDCSL